MDNPHFVNFSKGVEELIEPRELPRRKLINSGIAVQKFKRAVLEAAAELSTEYTDHFWKDIVLRNVDESNSSSAARLPLPSSDSETLKKAFIFYLNTSGRYLVLREHLRQAVSEIAQQRSIKQLKQNSSHRNFQVFLHDLYHYLIDEMRDTLRHSRTAEVDPLCPTPKPPEPICHTTEPLSQEEFKKLEQKKLLRELLFYAEESSAQNDLPNCQRLYLERICRSQEDPDCWIDFAIMWLNRCDDRMAEIAVREALKKDSSSIYALIIGGLIAIKNKDDRGIDCLAVALQRRQFCPELLVLIAFALTLVPEQSDFGADYFFRKAAHLHRKLTGQTTDNVDASLEKLSRAVGFKETLMNITQAEEAFSKKGIPVEQEQNSEFQPVDSSVVSSITVTVNSTRPSLTPSERRSSPSKVTIARTIHKARAHGSHHHHGRGHSHGHDKGHSSRSHHGHSHNASKRPTHVFSRHKHSRENDDSKDTVYDPFKEGKMGQEEEDTASNVSQYGDYFSRAKSISREGEPPRDFYQYFKHLNYDEDFNALDLADTRLPPLRPSIAIPLDITHCSGHLKRLLRLERSRTPEYVGKTADTSQGNSAGDHMTSEVEEKTEKKSKKDREGRGRKSQFHPPRSAGPKKSHKVDVPLMQESIIGELSVEEEQATTSIADHAELSTLDEMEEHCDLRSEDHFNNGQPEHPLLDNRLGSELIWTAQLLLELRMFDIIDGVLARELYLSGRRSFQYLYLRAMSLFLRNSYAEAIPVFAEALDIDKTNAALWALKGHCYYQKGDKAEAMGCYEKVLKLPLGGENRHLVYLRFGSLSLDFGNSDTAKRVFLYAIQKHPSPYLWLALGNACLNRNELDEAESAFSEANRLDVTNPLTWGHLSLINLKLKNQSLAEQSYKWALRFGLRKGKVLDEILKLQAETGIGDPTFPTVPTCLPFDYYQRRVGRKKPFDIYREALLQEFTKPETSVGGTPKQATKSSQVITVQNDALAMDPEEQAQQSNFSRRSAEEGNLAKTGSTIVDILDPSEFSTNYDRSRATEMSMDHELHKTNRKSFKREKDKSHRPKITGRYRGGRTSSDTGNGPGMMRRFSTGRKQSQYIDWVKSKSSQKSRDSL